MTIVYMILAFFSGVRIIQFFQIDNGPLDLFERLRTLIDTLEYAVGNWDTKYWYWLWYLINNFSKGFNCQLCFSVWVYGILSFFFWFTGMSSVYETVLIWFGLSGIYYLLVKG